MSKTGERYTTARRHLSTKRDPRPDPVSMAGAYELASESTMLQATGRGWAHWLSLLDEWGARDRKRGETTSFLMAEHGVPGWYAQAIASGFERTRGLRAKHQKPDGFTIYASKTVDVPIGSLYDAFVDPDMRSAWLTDGTMALRTSKPRRTAHFDWDSSPTRVSVTFEEKGPTKSTAAVAHERLPDATAAEAAKAAWKKRVSALKAFLESTTGTS
jgi:uncharacterized protein YndB with AHSA1/START domain